MRQIDPAKDDAGIGCSRPQCQLNALTTVQANANRFGQGFKGSLSKHAGILICMVLPRTEKGLMGRKA
jgi:hypothetical protein